MGYYVCSPPGLQHECLGKGFQMAGEGVLPARSALHHHLDLFMGTEDTPRTHPSVLRAQVGKC